MSNDPVLSRLGFARKAGKLNIGFAASKESVLNNNAKLIIVANDISPKTEKEIRFFAREKCPVRKISSSCDEMSAAIGVRAGVVALCDQGFADAILKFLS